MFYTSKELKHGLLTPRLLTTTVNDNNYKPLQIKTLALTVGKININQLKKQDEKLFRNVQYHAKNHRRLRK